MAILISDDAFRSVYIIKTKCVHNVEKNTAFKNLVFNPMFNNPRIIKQFSSIIYQNIYSVDVYFKPEGLFFLQLVFIPQFSLSLLCYENPLSVTKHVPCSQLSESFCKSCQPCIRLRKFNASLCRTNGIVWTIVSLHTGTSFYDITCLSACLLATLSYQTVFISTPSLKQIFVSFLRIVRYLVRIRNQWKGKTAQIDYREPQMFEHVLRLDSFVRSMLERKNVRGSHVDQTKE